MAFKVGDTVIVSNDIRANMPFGATSEMLAMRGQVVTISKAFPSEGMGNRTIYRLKEDPHSWNWSEEMFEPYDLSEDEAFDAFVHGKISAERYEEIRRERG